MVIGVVLGVVLCSGGIRGGSAVKNLERKSVLSIENLFYRSLFNLAITVLFL